jgi:hypothetical protein
VEDGQFAVLHTGDFRAEPWFLDDIRRNPFLQPYLAPPEVQESAVLEESEVKCPGSPLFKTLDTIYLDTECLLTMNEEVPTKVHPFLDAYMNDCDYNSLFRAKQLRVWSL